jgi:2-haloacid dehalogenase
MSEMRPSTRDERTMRYRAFVFDAYGTLFDVHAAVRRYAGDVGPDGQVLSEIWRAKQLEYSWTRTLMGAYRDFWALTEEALDYAFAKVPSVDTSLRERLLQAYWRLDCYPEVPRILGALKAEGAKVAILSNGSPAMLEAAVAAADIGDNLDAVLSVDRLRIYKPRPEVYALVTRTFSMQPAEVVFVSSNRWDIMGASAFGFHTAWVNRADLPDEYSELPPTTAISDLGSLLTRAW